MNLLLSVILAVFGTAVGIYFSFRLKERERVMSAALLFIKELAVRIRYTNAEIGEMLRTAADNEEYGRLIFISCCTDIGEGGNFHGKWKEGVKSQPYLTARDRELLTALGERLGETDCDGQLSFLEMTEELIKGQREQAAADYTNKGKLYRSVGLLCGLAAGIMLL